MLVPSVVLVGGLSGECKLCTDIWPIARLLQTTNQQVSLLANTRGSDSRSIRIWISAANLLTFYTYQLCPFLYASYCILYATWYSRGLVSLYFDPTTVWLLSWMCTCCSILYLTLDLWTNILPVIMLLEVLPGYLTKSCPCFFFLDYPWALTYLMTTRYWPLAHLFFSYMLAPPVSSYSPDAT